VADPLFARLHGQAAILLHKFWSQADSAGICGIRQLA